MNIIIVGCGKVGYTLAKRLNNENNNITIIDKNESVLRKAVEAFDVMGIRGNGAVFQVQQEAGIKDADILIAATDSDEVNMLCCLIAKKEGGDLSTIARIRDPEYSEEIAYLRDEFNLALAFNPELAAAKEVERLLRYPQAMNIDSFRRGKMDLMRVRIPKGSPLSGLKLHELNGRPGMDVLICAIERNGEIIIPSGNNYVKDGDLVTFIAKASKAYNFFKVCGIDYTPIKNCIIVGGGKITYYIAKYFRESGLKCKLKIIDRDRNKCEELAEEFPEATIIHGDGTEENLLKQEGIAKTDAFCSLTGFDEENIMLSLYAGKLSNTKLITKINRIAFENVTDDMNLGSVIYPKLIVADTISQYVRALENSRGSNIETLYKIADGKAEAMEFRVKEDVNITGITLKDLCLKDNVLIAAIVRKRKVITPSGNDVMLPNDRVIIITTNTGFNDLKDILK